VCCRGAALLRSFFRLNNECFATVALLVIGAISAGGATAATVRLLRYKNALLRISKASDLKEKEK
jgi:hypothetical protein